MAQENSRSKRGHLFIISGPSGVGKSTLRQALVKDHNLAYSVSATTRAPREGEVDGVDYEFLSTEEFEKRIESGHFIEWAKVFDQYYGTPIEQVHAHVEAGRDVILEIDVQGAQQIQAKQAQLGIPAYFVFIMPPSLTELEKRLVERGTNAGPDLKLRLREAESEMEQSKTFDLVVVNEDLECALREIVAFVNSARED